MARRFLVVFQIVLFCSVAQTALSAEPKKFNGERKAAGEKKIVAERAHTSLMPPDNSMINSAKPSISVEYADEGIGVNPAETRIYLDGADVTAQAQSTVTRVTMTPAQPLADGLHKVKVDIFDKAGNSASVSWSFTLRTQAPKIKITSHQPNQYLNQSPVLVVGTVDEANARVVLNGIAAAIERGAFSARVSLIEGINTITAVATDSFGNSGSDTISLTLDSKPPMIQVTSPLPNSLQNSRLVTISGTADAKAASIVVTSPAVTQPVTATIANGVFAATNVALAEGLNTITATATSNAGNMGTSTIKVTVDTVAPLVTLTTPKDQSLTNKKMITVTGTVDDSLAVVKVNNTPVQVSKGVFMLSGVNLAEGTNTITATAADRAGNQAKPAAVVVVLKTVPPTPPKIGDMSLISNISQITVTGTAEPGSQVELFLNSSSQGVLKTDDKGMFSFNVVLQEGNNAFSAVASDVVGNVSASSSVVNVFYDKTAPRIL